MSLRVKGSVFQIQVQKWIFLLWLGDQGDGGRFVSGGKDGEDGGKELQPQGMHFLSPFVEGIDI